LLRGGTAPTEAVETLAQVEHRPRQRRALRAVAARLRQGESLAQALGSLPQLELARETLAGCGEQTPAALDRLAAFYRSREELRATARAALLYPRLLLVGLMLLAVLLAFVVAPQFERLYASMGAGALTTSLQLLLSLSRWASQSMTELVVLAALATVALLWIRRRYPGPLSRLFEHVPVVGQTVRRLALAEFLEALALRLSTGTAMELACAQAARAVQHAGFRQRLTATAASVRSSGRIPLLHPAAPRRGARTGISEGLRRSAGLARPLEVVLVTAAEEHEPDMLGEAARQTSQHLEQRSHHAMRVLAPVMIVMLAIVVLAVALSLTSPIVEMASFIGGH